MIAFTGNPLDRVSALRSDAAWLAARRADPQSLILPVWRLRPFVLGPEAAAGPQTAGFLAPSRAETLAGPEAAWVLLGLADGRAVFALDISAADDPQAVGPLAGLGHFAELRGAAMKGTLPPHDLAMFAQAKAMIDWHQRHGFCARCGAATVLADAGYRRHCAACGADHFPRTDPVVIMLVHRGEECLVGRGHHFPPGMMSALAGFLEPGESIEEAVRRETWEETGIRVGAVRYAASQPWAFPSSLMIGCLAEAESYAITRDTEELADARWLGRDRVRALLTGTPHDGLFLPPKIAIAHHLLRVWAEE